MMMSEAPFSVRKVRSSVGSFTVLVLRGTFSQDALREFSARECNGLDWDTTEPSCDSLLELPLGRVKFMRLRTKRRVDDSAISELRGLRFLDCLSKGSVPLDLGELGELQELMIDDRPGMVLPQGPTIRRLELYKNCHRLGDLAFSAGLVNCVLENLPRFDLNLEGYFGALRALWIRKGSISEIGKLHAPSLTHLSVEATSTPAIDLNDLRHLPSLKQITVTSKSGTELANKESATAQGLQVLTDGVVWN